MGWVGEKSSPSLERSARTDLGKYNLRLRPDAWKDFDSWQRSCSSLPSWPRESPGFS